MTSLQKAFEQINRFAELRIEEANMPGMAIAITDREKVLRIATFGYADIASRAPIEAGSMFEIGSIGKSFTNIALMQLRDEGRLDLNLPVSLYLPWFEVQSEHGPITPHHLMSHTSGLVTGTEIAPHGYYESWALRETKTGAPPGEYFRYSNIGYKTLGFLLEEVAGEPYQDVIQARVLDPLGMRDSHPVISFETRKRAAVGYRSFYDDRPEHRDHGIAPALWSEYGAGDGCQASTAEDMATYLRMIMDRGSGSTGRLISEESFALMTRHVIPRPDSGATPTTGTGSPSQESTATLTWGTRGAPLATCRLLSPMWTTVSGSSCWSTDTWSPTEWLGSPCTCSSSSGPGCIKTKSRRCSEVSR